MRTGFYTIFYSLSDKSFYFTANAIECSEYMTSPEIQSMCSKLVDVLSGF